MTRNTALVSKQVWLDIPFPVMEPHLNIDDGLEHEMRMNLDVDEIRDIQDEIEAYIEELLHEGVDD